MHAPLPTWKVGGMPWKWKEFGWKIHKVSKIRLELPPAREKKFVWKNQPKNNGVVFQGSIKPPPPPNDKSHQGKKLFSCPRYSVERGHAKCNRNGVVLYVCRCVDHWFIWGRGTIDLFVARVNAAGAAVHQTIVITFGSFSSISIYTHCSSKQANLPGNVAVPKQTVERHMCSTLCFVVSKVLSDPPLAKKFQQILIHRDESNKDQL